MDINVPDRSPLLELLSYYRDAELHGAGLLLRLARMMQDDAQAQVDLTRHIAEETRHAWLWTRRIAELGGRPIPIPDGYQARIGRRTIPRTPADLVALTIVVEERSLARYQEHAARSNVDFATRRVLRAVARDEEWHVTWMREKLSAMTDGDASSRERADAMLARYRAIDLEVYRELRRHEDEAFADGRAPIDSGIGAPLRPFPPRGAT